MTTADGSVIGGERGEAAAGSGGAQASSTRPSWRTRLATLSPQAWTAALRAEAAGQAGRLFVWTPFAFGVGAAGYFALKVEPAPAIGVVAATAALALLAAGRRLTVAVLRSAILLLAVALIGFADGKLATERARGPVLPDGLGVRRVSGRVVDIVDAAGGKLRLLMQPASIDGLAPGQLPRRIRVTLREAADVEPGDALGFRAILDPPPAPPTPAASTSPGRPGSPNSAAWGSP